MNRTKGRNNKFDSNRKTFNKENKTATSNVAKVVIDSSMSLGLNLQYIFMLLVLILS